MAHTKLPWKVRKSDTKQAFNVIGTKLGGKHKIARCPSDALNGEGTEYIDEQRMKVAEDNANLIVKAVNCHNELLGALKDCRQTIFSSHYEDAVKFYGGEGSKNASDTAMRSAKNRVKEIDKAIENATL